MKKPCRLLFALLVAALGTFALLSATACAAPAPAPLPPTAGSSSSGAAGGASSSSGATGSAPAAQATASARLQSDWQHVLQVVANLRGASPSQPVVYLLGGSVARECIESESGWAAAVRDAGGPAALTFDLGSGDKTTAQDVQLVGKLPAPQGGAGIVFIGMNVGRFTRAPSTPSVTLPAPVEPLPSWRQHLYSSALSTATKRALVTKWLQRRYPPFKQYYTYNVGQLEKLIKACKAKGLRPVLLELPRNLTVIGTRMDAPVTRYHRSCAALAAKYDIPYVDFVKRAGLVNADFYDLWHLIKGGRAKWQTLLARRTATLLLRYAASPSSSPAP